jgi:hypothetical protein
MKRYLFLFGLCACFSDFDGTGGDGAPMGGGAPTTDSGSTSNGHHSSPDGSGSTHGSAGSTDGSGFDTSSFGTSTFGTSDESTPWGDGPWYEDCRVHADCSSPQRCLSAPGPAHVCAAPCADVGECPPGGSCDDVSEVHDGARECYLDCGAGPCPGGMTCVTSQGVSYCVWPV